MAGEYDPDSWFHPHSGTYQCWTDPVSGQWVEYRAVKVAAMNAGVIDSVDTSNDQKYPVAVYFHGLGEKVDIIQDMAREWPHIASEPFIIVAPIKPEMTWWFIDDGRTYGWVDGNLRTDIVERFSAWLRFISAYPCVDAGRIGMFGFSAGAYACTEIIAHGCIPLSGIGLGGVHGHGQRDIEDLPKEKTAGAADKFTAFLERLRRSQGVPFLEATHGTTDEESKWSDAQEIIEALNEAQTNMGLHEVRVRQLAPEEQDKKPSKKTNRTHHNYFNKSFHRKEFLVALFGGPPPPPPEPRAPPPPLLGPNQKLVFEWDAGDGRKSRWWRSYDENDYSRICEKFLEQDGKGVVNIELGCGVFEFDFDWMRQSDKKSEETWRIRQWAVEMSAQEIEAVGEATPAGDAPVDAQSHSMESERTFAREADIRADARSRSRSRDACRNRPGAKRTAAPMPKRTATPMRLLIATPKRTAAPMR